MATITVIPIRASFDIVKGADTIKAVLLELLAKKFVDYF